jgi:hypothetical protein
MRAVEQLALPSGAATLADARGAACPGRRAHRVAPSAASGLNPGLVWTQTAAS